MFLVWIVLVYIYFALGSSGCSGDCKQGREKCNCKL